MSLQRAHTEPMFKLGKIKNKYVIIEILAYTHEDYQMICQHLFSCSRSLRFLLVSTYNHLRFEVFETHNITIEEILPLTFNHKTSRSTHELLEKIVTL